MRTLLLLSLLLAGCATALDPTLQRGARPRRRRAQRAGARAARAREPREPGPARLPRRVLPRARPARSRSGWRRPRPCARAASPRPPPTLYRRVQKYDPDNVRARAGLQQLEADARHRALVAAAEKLVKDERYLEAQDVLRPVLVENPQQRDARRLQRLIEERTAKPAIVTPRLKTAGASRSRSSCATCRCARCSTPSRAAPAVSFVLDRDVRADQRTTIVLRNAAARGADPPGAHHQPARAEGGQREHAAGLSRTRRRSSASTRSWW